MDEVLAVEVVGIPRPTRQEGGGQISQIVLSQRSVDEGLSSGQVLQVRPGRAKDGEGPEELATVELDRKGPGADPDKGGEVDVRVDAAAAVDGEVVDPDQMPLGVASEEDQVPFRAEKLDELVLAGGVVDDEETAESGDGSVTGCAVLGLQGVLPGVVFRNFVCHC